MFFSKNKLAITNRDKIKRVPRPLALIILDGMGISPISEGNAVWQAKTPNLDFMQQHYVKTLLHSSGQEVGLPYGEFGNSEVGHLNLGSGRIVYQPLLRVSRAIESGQLDKNKVVEDMLRHLNKTKGGLHIMGLISAGGVHSHIEHLLFLLDWLKKKNMKKIYLHLMTDGRDSQPAIADIFLEDIYKKINELELDAKIASIGGRYFGMDRNKNWERTKKGYDAIMGTSKTKAKNAKEVVAAAHAKNQTDEFIEPATIIDENKKPIGAIKDGDALFCINFRPDRMRQIVSAFANNRFTGFKAKKIKKLFIATMTEYDETLGLPVVFPESDLTNTLAQIISEKKLKQLHTAETQKYPHVTYFFNGGEEKPFPGEKRVIVPSPNVATFDLEPEMSAEGVKDVVLKELASNKQDVYIINFANPDMVGHTGDLKAAIRAIEYVDECVGDIVKKILELDGAALITSDHGNAEEMINFETGEKDTEHNIYPAPLILAVKELAHSDKSPTFREVIHEPAGALADVAPTILDLLQIKPPKEMTGISMLNTMK